MNTGCNIPGGSTNDAEDSARLQAEIAHVQSFQQYERGVAAFPAAYANAKTDKLQMQVLLDFRDVIGERCKLEQDTTLIRQEAEEAIKMATDDKEKRATYMQMVDNELEVARILSGRRQES